MYSAKETCNNNKNNHMKCSESNRMKVREYCYVKRSRSMSVMLRYMHTKYAEFFGDFYSKY